MKCSWREKDDPVYNQLMKEFIEKVATYARGGSNESRREKLRKYKGFLSFVASKYAPEGIKNIQPKHVAAFVRYRREQGISESTIMSELSIIRWWQGQIPWRKFEIPDNNEIFELEVRLNEREYVAEIKEKYRRLKRRRGRI